MTGFHINLRHNQIKTQVQNKLKNRSLETFKIMI